MTALLYFPRIFFPVLLVLNAIFFPTLTFASSQPEDDNAFAQAAVHDMRVIILKAQQVEALAGKAFTNYSLMAVGEGRLQAIPFQFDDLSQIGQPYTGEKGAPVKGSVGKFDPDDEILFMFKDGGSKAGADVLANVQGKVIAEIAVDDAGLTHYVYVVEGNGQRSDKDYIEYDAESYLIKSDYWTMQTDPKNPIVWSDYTFHSFKEDHSILDTMKMRIGGKVGFITLMLNNNNVIGTALGFRDGPIRDFLEMKAAVVLAGIPFINLKMGFKVTQSTLDAPAYAELPGVAKAIKNPTIEISLDKHKLANAISRTALGPQEPAINDGKLSKQEEQMKVKGDHVNNTWLALSSQKGYDIMATLISSENFHPDLSVLYKEGKEDKPERFKGADPQLGYYIRNLPLADPFFFQISLFYAENFWGNNHPELFANYLLTQPLVTVVAF